MLVFPSAALGATYINVGGSEYTSAASGEGWSWDGRDNMTLEGYLGGSIVAEGDLVLNLVGENIVVTSSSELSDAGIEVVRGDLNKDGVSSETGSLVIVGEKGSLEVKGDRVGVYSQDGMTIKGTEVLAYAKELGIGTDGVLAIEGSTVGAMADSADSDGSIIGAYAYGLSIKSSSVEVVAKSSYAGEAADDGCVAGIDVYGKSGNSISIESSKVRASAISSRSGDSLTGISNLAKGGAIYVGDSDLTVYVSGTEDLNEGVGIYVSDGDLGVYNTDLSVTALGGAARGVAAQVVDDSGSKIGPEVTFANSNVSIEADGAAVTSIYYGSESEDASLERKGKIVLGNSVTSLGGQVQDILFELGEDDGNVWAAGQTIGADADSDGVLEESELASKVTIEAIDGDSGADVPAVPSEGDATSGSSDANASSSGSTIAQAGDDAAGFGFMAAFSAIAAMIAGFVAAVQRKFGGTA